MISLAPYIYGGQFARSFSDIDFSYCVFKDISLDFSEFNSNANVTHNKFYSKKVGFYKDEIDGSPVTLGGTLHNINISENIFDVTGISYAIGSSDIQGYTNMGSGRISIHHNIIKLRNAQAAIETAIFGDIDISYNTILGSVNNLFRTTKANQFSKSTFQKDFTNRFGYGAALNIHDNFFKGKINSIIFSNGNVRVNNNTFIRDTSSGDPSTPNSNGNIIYNSSGYDSASVDRFEMVGNWFYNWQYNGKSFSLYRPFNDRVKIFDNHFISSADTSVRTDKDFIINLWNPEIMSLPLEKTVALDQDYKTELQRYLDIVQKETNHALSDSTKDAVKYLFKHLYLSGLRSKITFANIFPGDSLTSRIMQIGRDNTLYTSMQLHNMTGADFNPNTGWKGNGVDKYFVVSNNINAFTRPNAALNDEIQTGLYIQTTTPSSTAAQTLAGTYSGNFSSIYRMTYTGSSMTGLGSSGIPGTSNAGIPVGGYFTAQDKGRSIALQYASNTTNTSNTALNTLYTGNVGQLSFLAETRFIGGAMSMQYPSNATLGAIVGTKYLTATEASNLAQIIKNVMIMLGRPVQTATPVTNYVAKNTVRGMDTLGNVTYTPTDSLVGASTGSVTSFSKIDNWGITSTVTNPTTAPTHAIGLDTVTISGYYQKKSSSDTSRTNIYNAIAGRQKPIVITNIGTSGNATLKVGLVKDTINIPVYASSTGSGLDPYHPTYIGGTPTAVAADAADVKDISISGKDGSMLVTFTVTDGASLFGTVLTVTYSSAWAATPRVQISKVSDTSLGTSVGAAGTSTSTAVIKAQNLGGGIYTFCLTSSN